jgi:transposase
MKRKRFTNEFKLEAPRLLEQGNKSGAVLARELGVQRNQLYKWRREVQIRGDNCAFKGSGRNAHKDNVSELTVLKRRVARLEEENAALKKPRRTSPKPPSEVRLHRHPTARSHIEHS